MNPLTARLAPSMLTLAIMQLVSGFVSAHRWTTAVTTDAVATSVARITAYVDTGLSSIIAAAVIVAFVYLTFGVLRWFEVSVDLRDVADATSPAVWLLAAYMMASTTAVFRIDPSSLSRETLQAAGSLMASMSAPEPWRALWLSRYAAPAAAGAVVVGSLRRRTGCGWMDATLSVGLSASIVLGAQKVVALAAVAP